MRSKEFRRNQQTLHTHQLSVIIPWQTKPCLSRRYLWWSFCTLYLHRIPGESYHRRLRSLLLHSCDIFWALINSLVCWFYVSALGLVLLQIVTSQRPTSIDSLSHPFPVLSRSCSSTQQAMLGCTPLQLDSVLPLNCYYITRHQGAALEIYACFCACPHMYCCTSRSC